MKKKNVEARIPGDDRRRAKTRTWKRATWCCPFWETEAAQTPQRSSRSRHKRAMTVTIEIEKRVLLSASLQSLAVVQATQWSAKGDQPLGPPWRTHREGRGGCQGSLRVVMV